MALNTQKLKTALLESALIVVWCYGILWAKENVELPKYLLWLLYASAPALAIKNLQSYWQVFRNDEDSKKESKVKPARKPLRTIATPPEAAPTKTSFSTSKPPSKPPKRSPVTKQGFKKRTPKKK